MPRVLRQGKYYHMNINDCLKTSHFGSKLKSLRKKHRVSAKKLAKASGVSIGYVYQQEKKIISDELFKKLRGHILEIKDKRPGPVPKRHKLPYQRTNKRSKMSREEKTKKGLEFKLLRVSVLNMSRKKLGNILNVSEDRIESWERGMGAIPPAMIEKTKNLQEVWKPPTLHIVEDFTPEENKPMLLKPGTYQVQNINDTISFTPVEADIKVLTKLQYDHAKAKQQLEETRQFLHEMTSKYDALVGQVQGLKALINI